MKILFVSSLYPKEYQEQLRREANGLLQNSVNVFQWAVVDGLVANKANFDIVVRTPAGEPQRKLTVR